MKVYVDLVFLLNVGFDFILLLFTSLLMHRHAKVKRILLGALFGGMSIFFLFVQMHSMVLFLLKGIVSVGMVLCTFGYKNKQYLIRNIASLYMVSIVMGGILYFLNVQFSYQQEGIVFYHKGLSINVLFLFIFTPIILYTYVRQEKRQKELYEHIYQVIFSIGPHTYEFEGFVDTGNQLKDPYLKRPVILVEQKKIEKNGLRYTYVPYDTVNHHDMLKCVAVKEVMIKGVGITKNVLVGLLDHTIQMDGVDCILHERLLEGK